MIRSFQKRRKRNSKRSKKYSNEFQNYTFQLPQNPSIILNFQVELPEELIFSEILTRLPVNSLSRFKSLSKTWNFMITSSYFIKSHLKCTYSNPFVPTNCLFIKSGYDFYILNYAAYDKYPHDYYSEKGLTLVKSLSFYDNGVNTFLIGSCNGLVCFGRGNYYFKISNPIMRQHVHVLDPLGNFEGKLIYGFGFVECKDDYVLFVGGLQRRSNDNYVYVYSLRSYNWKKVGEFHEKVLSIFMGGRGVLVNETLHWDRSQIRMSNSKCICGFDLVDQTFKDVKLPRVFMGNDQFLNVKLCEMGGNLCAWAEDINEGLEMWMLVQYGVWDSWAKRFKIDMIPALDNFYGCLESGKVLVRTDDGSLLLADPNQSPQQYTLLVKDLGAIEVVSYIKSPVSLSFFHQHC